MITKDQIMEQLKTVIDPELNFDIVALGLVYDVRPKNDGIVEVDVTLTSPGCPLAPTIIQDVANAIRPLEGVKDVLVTIVWEPAWSIEKIDPAIRLELGV